MKKNGLIFKLIVIFCLVLMLVGLNLAILPQQIKAAECGINIDPANGAGFPSGETLKGTGWVRIEYKDCTTDFPPSSIEIYRGVLQNYKNNGIKTLVILDYLTYPEAAKNIDAFAQRAEKINEELGSLIDAYEIWNEPDLAAQYILSPSHFAQIVNAVVPKLGGHTIILGGFASGQPSYLAEALKKINVSYSAIGLHPYGKQVGGYWTDWVNGEMVNAVNQYRAAAGGKPVWITEIGIDTDREDISTEYLRRVFSASLNVPVIIWFAWSDGMVPPFGITFADQRPKTTYTAYFNACGISAPTTISTRPPIDPPGGGGCGGGGNWIPGWIGDPPQPGQPSINQPGRERSRVIFNDYITYPLIFDPELSLSTTKSNKDVIIANMVQDQGYQVSCASPPLFISKKIAGEWQRYFEINNNQFFEELVSSEGSLRADLSQAQVMMFRGNENGINVKKNSSYEGYFGSLGEQLTYAQTSGGAVGDPVKSGVVNSLLTLEQQCTLKLNNLSTAKQLCEALADPSKCALKTPITGTDYYLYVDDQDQHKQSLLNAYNSSGLSCENLAEGWSSNLNTDQKTFDQLQNGFLKMPINLDKVYRYAFLVISLPQNTDDETGTFFDCRNTNPLDRFWFLNKLPMAYDDGPNCSPWYKIQEKDIPMFLAFKIPNFTTNKSKTLKFKDSADIAKNILTNDDQQATNAAQIQQVRDVLTADIKTNQQIHWKGSDEQKDTMPINCAGTPQCEGAHNSVILRQALVDIINGSMVYCERNKLADHKSNQADEMLTEYATQDPFKSLELANSIYSPTFQSQDEINLQLKDDFTFKGVLEIPAVSESENFGWGLRLNLDQANKANAKPGHEMSDVEIRFHLVAPIGINLEQIQKSLMTFFSLETFDKVIDTNCLIDSNGECGTVAQYFPIENIDLKFNSSDTVQYTDECNCLPEGITYNDLDKLAKIEYRECMKTCKQKSFTVSLQDNSEEQNNRLFFTGGKLGFMIRKLQENLREFGSKGYEYVKTCERIEDLFLGRCGSANAQDIYGPDGLPYNGRNDIAEGPAWGQERCQPLTAGNSPCQIDNLKTKLRDWAKARGKTINEDEITRRATNASIICKAESGGNAGANNQRCLPSTNVPPEKRTVDYSMGLFQINMLAHECHNMFSGYGWGDSSSNDPIKKYPWCEIKPGLTREMVDECANKFLDPNYNIAYALNISNGFANFNAWSTGKLCRNWLR